MIVFHALDKENMKEIVSLLCNEFTGRMNCNNCILRIAEKKKITRLFFLAVVSCIMKCKQNTVLVNKHSG